LVVDGADSVSLTATVSNDRNGAGVTWSVSGGGNLSNSTTTTATYTAPAATSLSQTVIVTVTCIADTAKAASITLTVPAAPSITTASPLNGAVGTAYSMNLAANGGIAPYTWTVASGSALPNGISLTSTGQITGIPPGSAAGTTNVTFSVKDSGTPNALTASKSIQFIVAPAPAITFVGTMPSAVTINTSYIGSAQASGGAGTLTYSVASGALPTGTTLNASTGAIVGTVTAGGTFNFSIGVADAFGDAASKSYTITVNYPAMSITTSSQLAVAYVNGDYSQSLAATGGTDNSANYTWALAGGTSLPVGLILSPGGVISGKPTGTVGTTTFSIQVTDVVAGISVTGSFSISVNAGMSITNTSPLPTGYVGSNYSVQMNATGGTGTRYIWTAASGSVLPPGLTLTAAGLLSGTPTTAATNSFNITVTDSASNSVSQTFFLPINASLSITSSSVLPKGYQGGTYSGVALTASGGTGTGYTWAWAPATGSSIPSGLMFSTLGVVSGTPTASGTFGIVVTVTDSASHTASESMSLPVEAALEISPNTLPPGTSGVAYTQALTATGGSGTGYVWTSLGNTNPALGIVLSASGLVSGTPTTSGSTTITAQVTDSEGHQTSLALTINVSSALTITTTSLAAGNQGFAYSQTLGASGGSGYSWIITSGNLTSYGLDLSTSGIISGTPTQAGVFNCTVQVTDSGNNTATKNLTIQVYPALWLPSNGSLPSGYANIAYSGTIAGSGGSGGLSIAVTSAITNNGTLGTSAAGGTISITGIPTIAQTESLSVRLTDTATSNYINQTYTFVVNTVTAPSLPTQVLPEANINQPYTSTIIATGGVGPSYIWSVNGQSVPTNGSAADIGSGLTVSNLGSSMLSIGGIPTSSGNVSFSAQVKDTTTNLTSSTQSYSVFVNGTGSKVSGQVFLSNFCGSVSSPVFTVSINTNPVRQITSPLAQYSFGSVPNGTYTITPSYSGPSGSSAVFYPASATITVNNGDVIVPNFNFALGFTVSGTVSYSGSHTGPVYVNLINGGCSGTPAFGTAITGPGNYTIHGVAPGTYSLRTWIDSTDLGLGEGILNASDPTGSSYITVSKANVTGANLTLADNDPAAAPTQTPNLRTIVGTHNGVVINFEPPMSANYFEMATSYDVAWSTSPTLSGGALASVEGTFNYKANGDATVWILNNGLTGSSSFNDGTTYYFMARANNGAGHGAWTVYGGSTATGVTVNPPSGAATISGNVTISTDVTVAVNAKLYVGFYSDAAGIYATQVNSPAVGSDNPFTIKVPTGTWKFFVILDQNNDGRINTGDVSNTRSTKGGPPTIAIVGSGTQNISLVNASVVSAVQTRYSSYTSTVGTSNQYSLTLAAGAGTKLPIAVEVTAASNPDFIVPMDLTNECQGCGKAQFQGAENLHAMIPSVGDSYTLSVKYSDGTTDTNVTAAVTGWNDSGTIVGPGALITNMLPTGTADPSAGTRTQPTFTWTYPAGADIAGDHYSFFVCCNGNSDVWDVPGLSSGLDGFTYAQVPDSTLTWNSDPSGSGGTTTLTNLTVGTQYTWWITAVDSNNNEATASTWYKP
jgi:Putative Ig domain.